MKTGKSVIIVLIILLLCGCDGIVVTNSPILPTQAADITSAPATTAPGTVPPPTHKKTLEPPTAKPTPTPTVKTEPVEISIMAVGDVMCQGAQIKGAYDSKTKKYSFDYSFQYVRDIISSGDLALANFECTLGGPGAPYSQDRDFNSPDSIIDALKWAGFDVLSTINNHSYDTGSAGMHRTIDVIRDRGLRNVGTRPDTKEPPYCIIDVKGIRVGVAAYSYETSSSKTGISLNGIPIKAADRDLVSVFYPANSAEEVKRMGQAVKDMRAAGAEIVVFFLHWGMEYEREPNARQQAMAQGLADAGVDIIFGSHSHVPQRIETIASKVTGKKTVVVYSLGNFISNMREEYLSQNYTEDCMIVNVKITKPADGDPVITTVEYLPTWTFMYTSGGLRKYTVVPLEKALTSPKEFGITRKGDISKAQKSYNSTQKLLAPALAAGAVSVMALPE